MVQFTSHLRLGIPIKRDQVFQRPYAMQARRQVQAALRELSDADAGLRHACRRHDAARRTLGYQSQLEAFWWALEALRLHACNGGLSAGCVRRLLRSAKIIAASHGVRPRWSRVAFLHGALHEVAAQLSGRDGDDFSKAWHELLGRYRGGAQRSSRAVLREPVPPRCKAVALPDAAALLTEPLPVANQSDVARVARARRLRLTGQLGAARAVAHDAAAVAEVERERRWELACIDASATGSLDELARLLRVDRAMRQPARLRQLRLWSHAVQSKQWMAVCPRAPTLRRMARRAGEEIDLALHACMEALERCYQSERPIEERIERLGRCLRGVAMIERMEDRLLVWAAATRWLVRVRRYDMAVLTRRRYRWLCEVLSHGHSADLLGALGDLAPSPPEEGRLAG